MYVDEARIEYDEAVRSAAIMTERMNDGVTWRALPWDSLRW